MKDRSRLHELRAELDRIDAALIDQAAARQRIVAEIGQYKQQQGRQLRDYRREREVLDGVRAHAAKIGLEPDLAEALLRNLIEASLTRQEQQRVGGSGRGDGHTVLVIGGAGLMGRWLARFFDSQGFHVQIADPASQPAQGGFDAVDDWHDAAHTADVIAICTPIEISRRILAELIGLADQQPIAALVFDIASVKAPLIESLQQAAQAGLNICSIHPMFGPDTMLLAERHVLFMDVGPAAAVDQARALFEDTMAEQVNVSLEQHDRLMALVLGLSHALNIAFADALAQSGLDAAQLAAISSTTFKRQLDVAGDVVAENDRLYFEIQRLNPYELAVLDGLLNSVQRLRSHVSQDDAAAFSAQMKAGYDWLQRHRQSKEQDRQ
ncbi:MAG: bifunctional chorismate mutase/prephenate dehydrogenase [Pseudomonadota bacterium]